MRRVGDAMSEPVIVETSTTIQDASARMLDSRSEAAIVVEDGKVRGLLTAEDVARALAEGRDVSETPAGAVAEADPLLVRVDEALAEVHQRMRAEEHGLAAVIGRDGEPVGLLADSEAGP
jgi:CBS domain-containing protein